jgi:hypothetical protein
VLLCDDLVTADVVDVKWRSVHGRRQWRCVAREMRRQARLCLSVERIRATGKAQGGAHGRLLHVLCVEARRQVAHVGAAAGAVGTQGWWSASARGRNDAQARARRGNWPGGPA